MSRTRTTESELFAGALDGALAALDAAGILASVRSPNRSSAKDSSLADALLDVTVDDRAFQVLVEVVSYCTAETATRLLRRTAPSENAIPLLVADRITSEARTILTDAGWSWLDRRGQLHLRAPAVRVDLAVPAAERVTASTAGPAITGRSGITIAYWLTAHPGKSLSPNRDALELCLAPSTISTTVRRLADAGLVDETGAAIVPELFWELAAVWRPDRTWLAGRPDPERDPSWRASGTAAAAAYGAPVAAAGHGPLELYVTGPVELSIATRRYGAATPGAGAAVIAVPPTSLVTDAHQKADAEVHIIDGWPAAPLLAVALDLARDQSRGREILSEWSAGHGIWL
jgi:hypothetical protein